MTKTIFIRKSFLPFFHAFIFAACFLFVGVSASAQQPFVTDNADVTDKGKFHFETSNELDTLQHSLFPVKYQNGLRAMFAYGLLKNVEVSVTGAFLSLVSDRSISPRFVSGIGDTTFAVKYNFRRERENSRLPAMTVSAFVQFPTGNARRSLVEVKLRNNEILAKHKAVEPITVLCLAGSGVFRAGKDLSEEQTLVAGTLIALEGGIKHEVVAQPALDLLVTKFKDV